MTHEAPPPVPGSAPAQQGTSPWVWVAVGCGGILVVGFIAFLALGLFAVKKGKEIVEEATGTDSFSEFVEDMKENPAKALAETAIRTNPELDLVATDDDAGTITFTNTKTGEEATLNFEDIAEGRFSMTTDEGEFRVDATDAGEGGVTFTGPDGEARFGASADLSDVPDWVPAYPGATDVTGTMHTSSADGVMGAFTGKSTDDAQKVVDHFKQLFEDEGYAIGGESMTRTGDAAFGGINGDLGDGRSINVMIVQAEGNTQVTINYNQKQQ